MPRKYKGNTTIPEPVSVIICAKNEAANLQRLLPLVLEQQYSGLFEVIVVNDGSEDNTADILSALIDKYAHLKVITIATDAIKHLPGKKYALDTGIKAAKYDQLLLTDADCRPASPNWLNTMTTSKKDVVLGYGAYEPTSSFLNKFIRWETVHTCMQYASYALIGKAYMGVGRNLAYKKNLLRNLENDEKFWQVYRNTPSGDDDLMISKLATSSSVTVILDPKAHTISAAPSNWEAWWKQKTRHISTGKYYASVIRNLLGFYAISHFLFWLSGLILIIAAFFSADFGPFSFWKLQGCIVSLNYLTVIVFFLFILRVCLYWINAFRWYRELNEKKLSLFFPLGDLGWALYNVFLSPYIFWKNKLSWK